MKNKKLMSILLVSAILGTTLGTTAVSAADETICIIMDMVSYYPYSRKND